MRIEVKGRNLAITDELRECVARKFEKIGRQVSELAVLEVELSEGDGAPDSFVADANLFLKGVTLRAGASSPDAKHAIICIADDMARQVKRHRDKRRARRESRAAAGATRLGVGPEAGEGPVAAL